MNQTLPEVIADILSHHGAVIEMENDKLLNVVVPQGLSKSLNIPEYARLSFSYVETRDEEIYASYDSEFFRSINNLFTKRGRLTIASFEPSIPNLDKMSRVVNEKIAFKNATFRLNGIDTSISSYLLVFFKYTALSDEKHEGLFPLLINELNLSSLPFESDIDELMERLKELDSPHLIERGQGEIKDEKKWLNVLQSAHISAIHAVKDRMKDFIKSLERRLNRDIKRVYEYYETLKTETNNVIERKGNSSDEEVKKLRDKLDIIEAEREWKVQDLVTKYALSIKVEPGAIFRIETRTPLFRIDIKRRLLSRHFSVTYNPIIKQLDPLPCESCFYPHGGYYICDDRLHIVCGNCFKGCLPCGKPYCNACYKDKCPRCKKENQHRQKDN